MPMQKIMVVGENKGDRAKGRWQGMFTNPIGSKRQEQDDINEIGKVGGSRFHALQEKVFEYTDRTRGDQDTVVSKLEVNAECTDNTQRGNAKQGKPIAGTTSVTDLHTTKGLARKTHTVWQMQVRKEIVLNKQVREQKLTTRNMNTFKAKMNSQVKKGVDNLKELMGERFVAILTDQMKRVDVSEGIKSGTHKVTEPNISRPPNRDNDNILPVLFGEDEEGGISKG